MTDTKKDKKTHAESATALKTKQKTSPALKAFVFAIILIPIAYYGYERITSFIDVPEPSTKTTKVANLSSMRKLTVKQQEEIPNQLSTQEVSAEIKQEEETTPEPVLTPLLKELEAIQEHEPFLQQEDHFEPIEELLEKETEKEIILLREQLKALSKRVVALEKNTQHQNAVPSLFADYYYLEKSILAGNSYQKWISVLQENHALPPMLHEVLFKLSLWANDGVPTVDQLFEQLDASMQTNLSGELVTSNEDNLWVSVKQHLTSMVKVRKVGGEHYGKDDASILARVQNRLAQEDYRGALNQLESLSPEMEPAFAEIYESIVIRMSALKLLGQVRETIFKLNKQKSSHDTYDNEMSE